MEEEFDLLPSMGDADLAVQLSELEKEKRRKIRRKEEEDRRYAERMLEKDFRKYARIHASREPQRVNHDDMLAIQQIEIDRGNYNVGSDPIPEVRHKGYIPYNYIKEINCILQIMIDTNDLHKNQNIASRQ